MSNKAAKKPEVVVHREARKPVMQLPKYYKRMLALMPAGQRTAFKDLMLGALRDLKAFKENRRKDQSSKKD